LRATSISVVIVEESWREQLDAGHADLSPTCASLQVCASTATIRLGPACYCTSASGVIECVRPSRLRRRFGFSPVLQGCSISGMRPRRSASCRSGVCQKRRGDPSLFPHDLLNREPPNARLCTRKTTRQSGEKIFIKSRAGHRTFVRTACMYGGRKRH
jgi:hypothetical protein